MMCRKHLWVMLLCCLAVLVGSLALGRFGAPKALSSLLIPLCPLSHIVLMGFVLKPRRGDK